MDSCAEASSVQTLEKWTTTYSADSVEWCPVQDYEHLLVCGTYKLVPSNETDANKTARVGHLHLFSFDDDDNLFKLNLLKELDIPGVLDIKWFPRTCFNAVLLASADATGTVHVYKLGSAGCDLTSIANDTVEPDNSQLALSLDWSNAINDTSQCLSIAASYSSGMLSIKKFNSTDVQEVSRWKAHEYEAWVVTFDCWDSTVVYSGGDDAKFKGWDLRQSSEKPVFSSSEHTMGVTSIQGNVWNQNLLATGSYDERILLWDSRRMTKPVSELNVGGGVWRLKWTSSRNLLAACMHAGAKYVDCVASEVLASYDGHESMVYGIDVCHNSVNRLTVASCSFYDCSLHIWKVCPDGYLQVRNSKA